jgi:putative flavoprotein involved in K+ transport
MEDVNTVVVGGGHAGLATSYELGQRGVPHIVLERSRPGEVWRSQRWDTFSMVSPNWITQLPGLPYDGGDPDGFLTCSEWLTYLDRYVDRFGSTLRTGVHVRAILPAPSGGRFILETGGGAITAANVVVAVGIHQFPRMPAQAADLQAGILHVHTSAYRNPEALPPGAVLVVGTGQSGSQITEELYRSGRQVFLSVGRTARLPRRYRGRDHMWWLRQEGFGGLSRVSPGSGSTNTGRDGGRSLSLHRFARDGVTLVGRLEAVRGTRACFSADIAQRLAEADAMDVSFKRAVDAYILQMALDAPPDDPPADDALRDGYAAPVIGELDLQALGITSVIWASGFGCNFGWVQFPVIADDGYPVCRQGVTAVPGLYFVGTRWRGPAPTTFISYVGTEAAHIAQHLADRVA